MQLTREFLVERSTAFRAEIERLRNEIMRLGTNSIKLEAAANWTDELIATLDKPEPEAPVETES